MSTDNDNTARNEPKRVEALATPPRSACCGSGRTTNGNEAGTRWHQCARCGGEFIDVRETIGYKFGCEDTEKKLSVALRGYPDSKLWGENGLVAATMNGYDSALFRLEVAERKAQKISNVCSEVMTYLVSLGASDVTDTDPASDLLARMREVFSEPSSPTEQRDHE